MGMYVMESVKLTNFASYNLAFILNTHFNLFHFILFFSSYLIQKKL